MLNKFPIKKNKENLIFIGLIFLLTIVFLHSIISPSKIMSNIHHVNDVTFISENLKQSLEQGQLHLWTPYYYSGRPLYAQPEYYFLDFNFLYILLFRNIYIAMNLATLTYFFLAGVGMYFLFLTFKENKKAAFIASIIYMFNGYIHSFVITGNLNVLAGYSLIPFAFMFFVKALQSKNVIKNSIFSALFIALQLFAGGTLLIPYEIILFGLYTLFYLLGKNLSKRFLKVALVGTIVILVSFGVSAIKLLPGIEFMDLSNRSAGVSYQEYLGEPIKLSNIINVLVTNLFSRGISTTIGIMGFILLIFSLFNFRKRYVMFSFALLVLSLLMATKGFVAEFFFKLPLFSQLRHIERAVFLTAFVSSLLAGTGFIMFSEKIKKVIKLNKNIVIFSIVSLLILVEILFLQNFPKAIDITQPNEIEINNYISQDKDTFRTINLGMSTLVGASGYNYLSQLGIGTIKGGSGIWFNDYLSYLSVAQQTTPAKLWGLLNNKYVIAKEELDLPGLKFIDQFEEDDYPIGEVDGPYLYENLEFLPRAYLIDKAILMVGQSQNAEQLAYSFIVNDNFNPKKAVIIHEGNSLEKYNLREFHAIVLSENLNQNEVALLSNYADNGGIIIPNIFENKNSIGPEDIKNLFDNIDESFEEIQILEYENNKAVYDVSNKNGFLVLSERFSNFPGWQVQENKEILKANVITTAILVENEEKITFKYKPSSFRKGLWISLLTLFLLIVYFTFSKTKLGGKNKS